MRSQGSVRCLGLAALVALAAPARAQDPPAPGGTLDGDSLAMPEALDLSEIVESATKSVTTVAESPGIITVVTQEEMRARGYRSINDLLDTLPGFEAQSVEWWYGDVFTRGNPRTLLVLWNGIPANNPAWASTELNRLVPLEFIRRVEIVTGPGGVLWGPNAFLGVVNIITHDGESFRGFEFRGGGGTGPGMRDMGRATFAFGEQLLRGRLKLYVGVNYSTDDGAATRFRFLARVPTLPPPDADGPTTGTLTDEPARPRRNSYLSVAGNVRSGPFTLDWYYPIINRTYHAVAWEGVRTDVGWWQGDLAPGDWTAWYNDFFVTSLSYQQRLFEKLGVTARTYFVGAEDISRKKLITGPGMVPQAVYTDQKYWTCPESGCTLDALNHAFDPGQPDPRWGAYRVGGSVDANLALTSRHRLIFGGEAVREHSDGRVNRATEVAGGALSMGWVEGARTVGGAFVADEWRAHHLLTLHAGARVQLSDAYSSVPLFSAAAVWSPMRRLFLKLNYAEGFRPPGLEATTVNDNRDPAKGPTNWNPHIANAHDLQPELSRAIESRLSLTTLEGRRATDKLVIHAGYAFTYLSNMITETEIVPSNAGTRYLHTGDLGLRLDLKGGHSLFLSYVLDFGLDAETGPLRGTANRKLTLGGRFALVKERLELDTLLVYLGPREDINRILTPTGTGVDVEGRPSSVAIDRLPPQATWRLGLRVRNLWHKRLELNGFLYNVLNGTPYAPDLFYSKRLDVQPIPGPGWSFLANAILTL